MKDNHETNATSWVSVYENIYQRIGTGIG